MAGLAQRGNRCAVSGETQLDRERNRERIELSQLQ
jgi:hypothetical protein